MHPDDCPKASKFPLIAEHVARDPGGSHSAFLPLSIIHCPWIKMFGDLLLKLEACFSHTEWIVGEPRFILKYSPYWFNLWPVSVSVTSRICCSTPVPVSQSRIVLSKEPDATSELSGEKATDQTLLEWPSRVCCSAPVAVFQSRIVLSSEPDASSAPSGEKATERIQSEWPSRVCSSGLRVSSTCGSWYIQLGNSDWNCRRTIALRGAKLKRCIISHLKIHQDKPFCVI